MENKLSITEIRYIRSLASKKTDEELAEMIGKPVALVQMQFALMSGLPKRPWEQGPVIQPARVRKTLQKAPKKEKNRKEKVVREKKKTPTKAQKTEKQSAHSQDEERMRERKKKLAKETFATRQLDLTGTVPVKLNPKTIVWVKPGTDIYKLKERYNIKS